MSTRSLSEISEIETVRIGLDLVSSARRNLDFLRTVNECQWLHRRPTIVEAVRRYDELWMPLISDLTVGSTSPIVLPPIDVQWVWFCHTLNPVSYKQYCESRFSKLIGKPAIFDEENEDYALMRCTDIWIKRYPNESFENEADSDSQDHPVDVKNNYIFNEVMKQRHLYSKFSGPYMSEIVYLIAAKQRYKGFLLMLQKFSDRCSKFVPALDVLLMWLTHQSYPTMYVEDLKEMWDDVGKVARVCEDVKEKDAEETKKLWDTNFDQPYEKAGGGLVTKLDEAVLDSDKPPVYWVVSDSDVNTRYKSLLPRFLLEVCVFVRLNSKMKAIKEDVKHGFLRLRMVRCHKVLKLDNPISTFSHDSWQKAWHVYCEFGTRGVVLEQRHLGGRCFKASTLQDKTEFHWNDLLRAHSLTLARELDQNLRVIASITPPVQASYLLKCVSDRVTDDSGAMISDVILKMNQYRPQEGRWLSRTVLDHAGRECFVVRLRVGRGFWRRGGEAPSAVKWDERVIEIREGSWSYVAGSIGRVPEKVVGTAIPKHPTEQWQAAWQFSTGEELMIRLDSSTSIPRLSFHVHNPNSNDSSVTLLGGRKLQYRVKKKTTDEQHEDNNNDEEEDGFVTVVRFTSDNPTAGKATALINWKLLVVEVFPEEDTVLVLLLCVSILRSVSEIRKEDVGNLLIRRRLREAKIGAHDWGSVTIDPSKLSGSVTSSSSQYVEPWYMNANSVMAPDGADQTTRLPVVNHSPVEGGDKLYKQGFIL